MTSYLFIDDKRINAQNYVIQLSLGEYYNLIKDKLNDNEYQRKRVRNAGSIYDLLKQDLIKGCVMPPIVLAYCENIPKNGNIVDILKENPNGIKILDGLQRSYTIREVVMDYESGKVAEEEGCPLNNLVRIEIYTGINKLGILYRMLTLNTGQTRMTTRHQIEIIYSDYKVKCQVQGVTLISEVDSVSPRKLGEYHFRDIVEGFTSYIQEDYLTLDRMDILDNVKDLERLAKVTKEEAPFDEFLSAYHHFVYKINNCFNGELNRDEMNLKSNPYALTAIGLFNKSQSMTGFGNAVSSLKSLEVISSFRDVDEAIEKIDCHTVEVGLYKIVQNLDLLREKAKKIGNDQRLYFYRFFRRLFDKEGSEFGNVHAAAEKAYNDYLRETR